MSDDLNTPMDSIRIMKAINQQESWYYMCCCCFFYIKVLQRKFWIRLFQENVSKESLNTCEISTLTCSAFV